MSVVPGAPEALAFWNAGGRSLNQKNKQYFNSDTNAFFFAYLSRSIEIDVGQFFRQRIHHSGVAAAAIDQIIIAAYVLLLMLLLLLDQRHLLLLLLLQLLLQFGPLLTLLMLGLFDIQTLSGRGQLFARCALAQFGVDKAILGAVMLVRLGRGRLGRQANVIETGHGRRTL